MRTRLKDIADDLKISTGLVSGVLNGRDNVWASEETRRKIFEAAKRLQYVHSIPEKANPAATSGALYLLYERAPNGSNDELSQLLTALSTEAQKTGMALSVCSFENAAEAGTFIGALTASKVEAVVIRGSAEFVQAAAKPAETQGFAFVIDGIHSGADPTWPQFDFNFEDMIAGAIDHVRVFGHRRIAYIGCEDGSRRSEVLLRAFGDWMKSCFGVEPRREFLLSSKPDQAALESHIDQLLDLPEEDRPTGFVLAAGNDAWTSLELCLHRRGLKLGFGKRDRLASGIFQSPFRLLFGEGLGYDIGSGSDLMDSALAPLLKEVRAGEPVERLRLHLPRLIRLASLDIRELPKPGLPGEVKP